MFPFLSFPFFAFYLFFLFSPTLPHPSLSFLILSLPFLSFLTYAVDIFKTHLVNSPRPSNTRILEFQNRLIKIYNKIILWNVKLYSLEEIYWCLENFRSENGRLYCKTIFFFVKHVTFNVLIVHSPEYFVLFNLSSSLFFVCSSLRFLISKIPMGIKWGQSMLSLLLQFRTKSIH